MKPSTKGQIANVSIDDIVLAAIKAGAASLRDICVAVASHPAGSIPERKVDRSLQRMRKKKLIESGGPGTTFSGWRAT